MSFFLFLQNKFTANKLLIFSFLKYVIKIAEIPSNNIFGVPRQLAGRALHCNLFFGEKPQKRISVSITNAT